MTQGIDFINLAIILSVLVCASANILAAVIIYRRDPQSREHQYFMMFLFGIAGFVSFYLFLQSPILSDYSYFFQIVSVNTGLAGLTFFYYALSHEGRVSRNFVLSFSILISILPALCLILHPFVVIPVLGRFEYVIQPWFMALVDSTYSILGFYVFIGLVFIAQKSNNQALKRKISIIFYWLINLIIFGLIFFAIIPGFFSISYLKPIGYLGMAIGSLAMAYIFKGKKSGKESSPGKIVPS